jgi:signal transduction histidine kinase
MIFEVMESEPTAGQTDPAPDLRSRSAPIIERAPLPIVEVQGSAHIVSYVNSAFCTLVGKTREELIGKPFGEIVCGGEDCVSILDRVYQTGEAATHAHEDPSDPNPAYWLYAMWPALDANQRPVGVIIQLTKAAQFRQNATEITEALLIAGLRQHELTEAAEKLNEQLQTEIVERKQFEEALRHAKDRLADRAGELDRLVKERTTTLRETVGELEAFAYAVVHDLRGPLRAMHGFARILAQECQDKVGDTGRDYIRRIIAAADRMDLLIQDVLSLSQIARSDLPLRPVNVDRLLRGILESYPNLQAPHADIEIQGELPAVLGNEAALTQLIYNLLENGCKFIAAEV